MWCPLTLSLDRVAAHGYENAAMTRMIPPSISRLLKVPIVCLAVGSVGAGVLAARQNPTLQGHPDDYVRADIEYGARLYAEQCTTCHGESGDGVTGVDLRSGKFKNA